MARRSSTADDVLSGDALNQMPRQEFETLVGNYFRNRGYAVVETGCGDVDDCVDLVVTRGGGRYLVQCKQVRELRIDIRVLRELYGVMAARRAAGCFVVTSGDFTDEARRFAAPLKMGLIDGARLAHAIAEQRKPKNEFEFEPSGPKNELDLLPSGRREPRLDEQWAANAAEIAGRRSIDFGTPNELDALATRRSLHEDSRRRNKRSSSAWFTAIAGGISIGGLLLYLFVMLSEIGPPKELARPAEVQAKGVSLENRRSEGDKRASEGRERAAVRQAKIVGGNEQADRKEAAWQQFYKASETCRADQNRGSIACVNEYMRAKVEFEKRWLAGQP